MRQAIPTLSPERHAGRKAKEGVGVNIHPEFKKAFEMAGKVEAYGWDNESLLSVFLSNLPKPETPYEQATMYRKLVGMEP